MSSFNTAQTMEKKESTNNGIKRMIFVVVSMVLEVTVIDGKVGFTGGV